MADAAMSNGNFNFTGAEFTGIVTECEEFGTRRVGRKTLNLSHDCSAVLDDSQRTASFPKKLIRCK
jgi:hypothetical protein